ncbi:MAG TPA: amidophosphoribosyltransferase, partial [Coxiellaceae bacterium]|nr:amidophosphoribosyltransferase [Coxiellaceae bacterium]
GSGLVRDVIHEAQMARLQGNMGLGHVRYPTAGSMSSLESQPFYVNSPYGLSIVHNGNLTNASELARDLINSDLRHLNTDSDSEVLLNVFAHELLLRGKAHLTTEALFESLKAVYRRVRGGYAAIIMINGYGLLAFRDPYGIRPLVYGERVGVNGKDIMIASENIVQDALGYHILGDVQPGEGVFVDMQANVHRQICSDFSELSPCIFEYIYLARPDSVLDNVPVHRARSVMGEKLAEKIKQQGLVSDIDVVIPIPDTSRNAAMALAAYLKLPYAEGFVKNRYIGRTFIMPQQLQRRSAVRKKLNAIRDDFMGKNVLLIDDSIVRGTTSREIVQMAREAGAKKVYFASAAPEVRFPNVYGIDMPVSEELIAHNKTVDEVAKFIGADWLVYQDLKAVYEAINEAARPSARAIKRFEDSVFTGDYITGDIDANYLTALKTKRNDQAKQAKKSPHDEQQLYIF